jgi:hypothetical protein
VHVIHPTVPKESRRGRLRSGSVPADLGTGRPLHNDFTHEKWCVRECGVSQRPTLSVNVGPASALLS